MTKNKQLPADLPETEHTFQIDIQGRITKKRFLGEFTCKIATIKDQAMIAKHEVLLNGDNPMYLDAGIRKINKQIAYLRFTITDAPIFWKKSDLGYDLRDDNVIEEVYNQVIEFENNWINQIWVADETVEEEENGEGSKEEEKA